MKKVEFFRWLLPPDKWNKRPHLSRWKMSREQAEKSYPGATPDLTSREVREINEGGEPPIPADAPYARRGGGNTERQALADKLREQIKFIDEIEAEIKR